MRPWLPIGETTRDDLPEGFAVERLGHFHVVLHHPHGGRTTHETTVQARAWARYLELNR